ncbi:hypothetical protein HJFPF1_05486 [Paramyrothecium foliicola]|nr:hypothetical protein HJFPF1_05486 [Paramyrothecium foliicola]
MHSPASLDPYEEELAQALRSLQKFQLSRNTPDIDSAVSHGREAAALSAHNPEHAIRVHTVLGAILFARGQSTQNVADAMEAVQSCRAALEGSIENGLHADIRGVHFTNLSNALRFCCRMTDGAGYVEEAVGIIETIKSKSRAGAADQSFCLKALAELYEFAHQKMGDSHYQDDAIKTAQLALASIHESGLESLRLETLGIVLSLLSSRYSATKNASDWTSAAQLAQDLEQQGSSWAGSSSASHRTLGTLSDLFIEHYETTNEVASLLKSIEYNVQLIVGSNSKNRRTRETALQIYGLHQKVRLYAKHTGDMPSVDLGVLTDHPELIVSLIPDDFPGRADYLHKLSLAFQHQFTHETRLEDLAENAVVASSFALQAAGEKHPKWGAMNAAYWTSRRMWSEATGKMPDAANGAMIIFEKKGLFISPETEAGLSLKVPHMISWGELDPELKNF